MKTSGLKGQGYTFIPFMIVFIVVQTLYLILSSLIGMLFIQYLPKTISPFL